MAKRRFPLAGAAFHWSWAKKRHGNEPETPSATAVDETSSPQTSTHFKSPSHELSAAPTKQNRAREPS